jgi:hypothetical protein
MLVDDKDEEDVVLALLLEEEDEVVVLVLVLVVDNAPPSAMVNVYGTAVPAELIEANTSCITDIWNSAPAALSQVHGVVAIIQGQTHCPPLRAFFFLQLQECPHEVHRWPPEKCGPHNNSFS